MQEEDLYPLLTEQELFEATNKFIDFKYICQRTIQLFKINCLDSELFLRKLDYIVTKLPLDPGDTDKLNE